MTPAKFTTARMRPLVMEAMGRVSTVPSPTQWGSSPISIFASMAPIGSDSAQFTPSMAGCMVARKRRESFPQGSMRSVSPMRRAISAPLSFVNSIE